MLIRPFQFWLVASWYYKKDTEVQKEKDSERQTGENAKGTTGINPKGVEDYFGQNLGRQLFGRLRGPRIEKKKENGKLRNF